MRLPTPSQRSTAAPADLGGRTKWHLFPRAVLACWLRGELRRLLGDLMGALPDLNSDLRNHRTVNLQ